ncbi:unnamed protein product [Lactuca saligna]|uniref:Uncharacterized protein n=1 Tax=Lactuca saligna TaxID=75948 RepID=A0AA36E335_LACSI|nr:unnamed protein product [Lactuca saligna]
MASIRTAMASERVEEVAFREVLLDWMKQQNQEFFSDISIVSDPTGTLPKSVVDDASRDSSSIVSSFQSHTTSRVVQVASLGLPSVTSPMILDEIDRESNEISPPDGDEVLLGVYE